MIWRRGGSCASLLRSLTLSSPPPPVAHGTTDVEKVRDDLAKNNFVTKYKIIDMERKRKEVRKKEEVVAGVLELISNILSGDGGEENELTGMA